MKIPRQLSDLIGMKVIVRSNNDEPYFVGEVVEIDDFKGTKCPVVRDSNGKNWGCMGITVPHSDQLASMLDGMTPREQWNLLLGISLTIQLLR